MKKYNAEYRGKCITVESDTMDEAILKAQKEFQAISKRQKVYLGKIFIVEVKKPQ